MRSHTFREHSAEGGSAAGRLSHCSLQGRIKRAEKPGPVPVGQRSRSAGIRSQLPQVPGYLSTGERITYIRQCPLFANRRDAARAFFETACCQRDIRGDAYVGGRDVLCNPVVSRVCAFTHQNHNARSRCRAAGSVASRWRQPKHLAEGAPPRGRSPPAPGTHHHRRRLQSNSSPLPHHISHSRSFDHRLRARAPFTAMASAFRCPTRTTRRFPRVTPV